MGILYNTFIVLFLHFLLYNLFLSLRRIYFSPLSHIPAPKVVLWRLETRSLLQEGQELSQGIWYALNS